MVLTRLGYTVLLATNGREGLDTYLKERAQIDVTVLDLSMPEMSGVEVLKRIREIDRDAKIIVSSGHAIDGPSGLEAHFKPSGVLSKPYTHTEMAMALRQALDSTAERSDHDA